MRRYLIIIIGSIGIILSQDESWKLYDDSEVDEVYITVDSDRLDWIYENVESDSLHPATMRYVSEWFDETLNNVGFRLRGNTSRGSEKKSFKLDINYFEQGRNFYGVEKINLNGEHNDPSIIRSKLCWDIYQDLAMRTSRSTHIAVYINEEYYGLYISVEHIDDEFLEKNFSDDSGNLWKCIWPADLTYRGDAPEDYHPYYDDARPYSLKTNKDSYDFSQLARLIGIINQTPEGEFADSLEAVLNISGVLKYLAVNVLTGGWDDYWFLRNNYYLYHHPTENRFHWIPYDYDNTLGIDWFEIDWTDTDPYDFPIIDNEGRPLAERLMAHDEYRDLYTHFIDFISTNIFELSHWEERMDNLKVNIDPWVELDQYRTYDYGFTIDDYHNSFSADHFENLHVKRGIREFVNLRSESITNLISYSEAPPVVYDYSWSPQHPFPGDSIIVHASVFGSVGLESVEIHFRETLESEPTIYPMIFSPIEGTKILEEADRWIGVIPPFQLSNGYFQIYCGDLNGQSNVFPRHKLIEISLSEIVSNNIVLNEFLASNDTINFDEAGEYDDWIELYNTSNNSENLGGMFLTDNPDNLPKWMIPFNTVISPGGHLLFWCDNDVEQGNSHTNFKLSAGGEFLALVHTNGITVVDSLTFGEQETDVSYGRLSDGSNQWDFQSPSPGTSNGSEPVSIELSYHEGWNLVGLPIGIDNSSYEIIFPNSTQGTLYGFDGTYFDTEILEFGNGYWLYFEGYGTNMVTGDPVVNLNITLSQGWNLVSGITFDKSVDDILDFDNIVVSGSWYGFNETYFSADSLFPGEGYWVNANADGVIGISNSMQSSYIIYNQPEIENANILKYNNQILLFGSSINIENPENFLLPPKPPSGGNDIRFSGDTKLCATDECLIEIAKGKNQSIFEFDIKDGQAWEIIPVIHKQVQLDKTIQINSGFKQAIDPSIEQLILRKSLDQSISTEFVLFPAYPNPFNPITTIQFFVPKLSDVNVTIYNIKGELVDTLIKEALAPGEYTVQWNAIGFTSGIYFVKLHGSEFSQTLRILLIK